MNVRVGLITLISGMFLGLISCQKQQTTVAPTDDVNITITAPKEGQTFKQGDIVNIAAEVSYTGQMHGYIIKIKDAEGSIIYETEGHKHGDNFIINEEWTNSSTTANLILEVTAVINHNQQQKTTTVGFKSQP